MQDFTLMLVRGNKTSDKYADTVTQNISMLIL